MKRLIAPLASTVASLVLLNACVTDSPRGSPSQPVAAREAAPPLDPKVDRELKAAIAALRGPDNKRAVARLRKIVKDQGTSPAADEARMALADSFFESQNCAEAYPLYVAAASGTRGRQATLRGARCLLLMHKPQEALKAVESNKGSNDSPEDALEERRIRYEAAVQERRNLDALRALIYLSENAPTREEKDRYRSAAVDAIESRLSEDEVRQVISESEFGAMRAHAKFRYGSMLLDQRQVPRAKSELSDVASLAKGTELGTRAQRLLDQLESRQKVDSRTIGVVLPLSGKQAATGYKSLRGVQLGLGIYGKVPSGLRLAVIDSEGNPDVARRAVERLVIEDGAIAIIGGLLSKTASAEAAKAQELGVPAIMLSQKAGVTQAGDAVFRNAFTSQMQVQRLVEIAMGELKMSRFAILFPNDAYGVEYSNLFWDEVSARGGSIVGAQPYDPKARDFRQYVQRLAGVFYLEDRWEEYRTALRKWQQKNPKRSLRNTGPTFEDLVGPAADFDAVFVPDKADAIRLIAPALPLYDLRVRLLGTNLWNRAELVEHKNRDIERAIFVDSLSGSDTAMQNSEFNSNFRAIFGEEPGTFELQAYDSGLILRQIVSGGESTRLGVMRRLADLKDFPGGLGKLSATPNREIKRPMVGLTIRDGKIVPLDETTQR